MSRELHYEVFTADVWRGLPRSRPSTPPPQLDFISISSTSEPPPSEPSQDAASMAVDMARRPMTGLAVVPAGTGSGDTGDSEIKLPYSDVFRTALRSMVKDTSAVVNWTFQSFPAVGHGTSASDIVAALHERLVVRFQKDPQHEPFDVVFVVSPDIVFKSVEAHRELFSLLFEYTRQGQGVVVEKAEGLHTHDEAHEISKQGVDLGRFSFFVPVFGAIVDEKQNLPARVCVAWSRQHPSIRIPGRLWWRTDDLENVTEHVLKPRLRRVWEAKACVNRAVVQHSMALLQQIDNPNAKTEVVRGSKGEEMSALVVDPDYFAKGTLVEDRLFRNMTRLVNLSAGNPNKHTKPCTLLLSPFNVYNVHWVLVLTSFAPSSNGDDVDIKVSVYDPLNKSKKAKHMVAVGLRKNTSYVSAMASWYKQTYTKKVRKKQASSSDEVPSAYGWREKLNFMVQDVGDANNCGVLVACAMCYIISQLPNPSSHHPEASFNIDEHDAALMRNVFRCLITRERETSTARP